MLFFEIQRILFPEYYWQPQLLWRSLANILKTNNWLLSFLADEC